MCAGYQFQELMSNMEYTKKFRVEPDSKVDLAKVDADFKDEHTSQKDALAEIEIYRHKLLPRLRLLI